MSTFGPTPTPTNVAGAADFRTWCQTIHNALIACGLVQTADTGQANLATIAPPGATVTAAGYEIFRLNDGFQVATPVFIKIEYGVGAALDTPELWITTGGVTNGAGVLSQGVNRLGVSVPYSAQPRVAWQDVYASGDGSRFALAWGVNPPLGSAAGSYGPTLLAVERSRDSNGNYTGDEWVQLAGNLSTGAGSANAGYGIGKPGVNSVAATNNGPLSIPTYSTRFGGVQYIGAAALQPPVSNAPPLWLLGVLGYVPATGGITAPAGSVGVPFQLTCLGKPHTYIFLQQTGAAQWLNLQTSNMEALMLWE